ncbi:MAG: universal stress protein [Desulfurococcales archaeon]|nr:universal stress protein [Desulfurococcales archaeon]
MAVSEPLTRILLPLDVSPVSMPLAEVVGRIAHRYDSEVLLFHVIDELVIEHVAGGYDPAKLIKGMEENALKLLRSVEKMLREMNVRVRIIESMPVADPASAIAHTAVEEDVSEIVVSSKGWGIRRLIPIGSTTHLLAKITPRPLIRFKVYHEDSKVKIIASDDPFKTIIVGVDEKVTNEMLDYLAELAKKAESRLIVIHVEEEERLGEKILDKVVKYLDSRGIREVDSMILTGRPARRLREAAKQLDATAVFIGSVGRRTTLKEILLGSTIGRLLHSLEEPLIIYPIGQVD